VSNVVSHITNQEETPEEGKQNQIRYLKHYKAQKLCFWNEYYYPVDVGCWTYIG